MAVLRNITRHDRRRNIDISLTNELDIEKLIVAVVQQRRLRYLVRLLTLGWNSQFSE